MKTLCHKKTDESLFIFSDSTEIYIANGSLWFKYKEKPDFEIKGFDEENFIIYENIDAPKSWLNKTYKYNPDYGWKLNEDYTYAEHNYEHYIRGFLKLCRNLKEKNILSDTEYQKLTNFKQIEHILYHPISYYEH